VSADITLKINACRMKGISFLIRKNSIASFLSQISGKGFAQNTLTPLPETLYSICWFLASRGRVPCMNPHR
jgi:hypothetical protein